MMVRIYILCTYVHMYTSAQCCVYVCITYITSVHNFALLFNTDAAEVEAAKHHEPRVLQSLSFIISPEC